MQTSRCLPFWTFSWFNFLHLLLIYSIPFNFPLITGLYYVGWRKWNYTNSETKYTWIPWNTIQRVGKTLEGKTIKLYIYLSWIGVFQKRFLYWIQLMSTSNVSTIMHKSEQMIRLKLNIFTTKDKTNTYSEHLTHSDDCVSIYTSKSDIKNTTIV